MQLGAETTVDAEKLLVHDRSQRQGAERIHAGIVDLLRIFVPTFKFKGEIVG